MYSISNKGFGILLLDCDKRQKVADELIHFARELCAVVNYDDQTIVDTVTWEEPELREHIEQVIGDEPWGWSTYSGDGQAPVAIGFHIGAWDCWELEAILASEKENFEKSADWNQQWKSTVPKEIQALCKKHGLKPCVFWASSTS